MSKRGDITFTAAMVEEHARKHGLAMPEGLITGAASPDRVPLEAKSTRDSKKGVPGRFGARGAEVGQKQPDLGSSTLKTGGATKHSAGPTPAVSVNGQGPDSFTLKKGDAVVTSTRAWARPIVIILPIPDRRLSPNARCHWAEKAKLTKAHRTRAMLLALAALSTTRQPKWQKATVQVQWFSRTAKVQDEDNLIATLKHVGDALQDSQIVTNDRGLTWLPPIQSKDARNPRVVLTVTPME